MQIFEVQSLHQASNLVFVVSKLRQDITCKLWCFSAPEGGGFLEGFWHFFQLDIPGKMFFIIGIYC